MQTTREKIERGIHDAFYLSILGKGVFAFAETVLGILFLFVGANTDLIVQLVESELLEDPSDFLANWTSAALHPTLEAQVFGGLYFVSHGVIKIFLAVGLLRDRSWAYPAALGVFSLFLLNQMFRYFFRAHSPVLLGIMIVDAIVIWLVYHEYKKSLKREEARERALV